MAPARPQQGPPGAAVFALCSAALLGQAYARGRAGAAPPPARGAARNASGAPLGRGGAPESLRRRPTGGEVFVPGAAALRAGSRHAGTAVEAALAGVVDLRSSGALLNRIRQGNCFVTLYTTWCPDCIMWRRDGLPAVDRLIQEQGLAGVGKGKIQVVSLDVERKGVSNATLGARGLQSWFVPGIFAIRQGISTRGRIYPSSYRNDPHVIFDWLLEALNIRTS